MTQIRRTSAYHVDTRRRHLVLLFGTQRCECACFINLLRARQCLIACGVYCCLGTPHCSTLWSPD